jgi:type IV pilus assembly protein PilX
MVITLVCLVLMLIAAVALTRASTNTLLQAGNFAFKRDLLNQAERGLANAVYELNSGALLASEVNRRTNQLTANYSATQLESNAQGIPKVLINNSTYTSSGMSLADFTDSTAGITIRTVIDRQCSSSGAFSTTNCVSIAEESNAAQSGTARLKRIKADARPTYRITVRITGPRDTQAFQQMIIAL